jgi:hypothetical protein
LLLTVDEDAIVWVDDFNVPGPAVEHLLKLDGIVAILLQGRRRGWGGAASGRRWEKGEGEVGKRWGARGQQPSNTKLWN